MCCRVMYDSFTHKKKKSVTRKNDSITTQCTSEQCDCVTWLRHMCGMTHSQQSHARLSPTHKNHSFARKNNSFTAQHSCEQCDCVTWLRHVCVMTHFLLMHRCDSITTQCSTEQMLSHVTQGGLICVAWLIHRNTCGMTPLLLMHMCDMTQSRCNAALNSVTVSLCLCVFVLWSCVYVYVCVCVYVCVNVCVCVYICHMTQFRRHAALNSHTTQVTRLICVARLIHRHICGMTHSLLMHICATHMTLVNRNDATHMAYMMYESLLQVSFWCRGLFDRSPIKETYERDLCTKKRPVKETHTPHMPYVWHDSFTSHAYMCHDSTTTQYSTEQTLSHSPTLWIM